jgi:hypothetical protein
VRLEALRKCGTTDLTGSRLVAGSIKCVGCEFDDGTQSRAIPLAEVAHVTRCRKALVERWARETADRRRPMPFYAQALADDGFKVNALAPGLRQLVPDFGDLAVPVGGGDPAVH